MQEVATTTELIASFKELGPPLGAVLAMGIIMFAVVKAFSTITIRILTMFDEHAKILVSVKDSVNVNTNVTDSLKTHVDSNNQLILRLLHANE